MNKELEQYIKDIQTALAKEKARHKPVQNAPSPSDILLAAREIMKRAKEKNARSNQSNS